MPSPWSGTDRLSSKSRGEFGLAISGLEAAILDELLPSDTDGELGLATAQVEAASLKELSFSGAEEVLGDEETNGMSLLSLSVISGAILKLLCGIPMADTAFCNIYIHPRVFIQHSNG
jgi:hypothetical protein